MNVLWILLILIVYLCIVYLHRGEEISEKMLDHKNAVVWDEAENRLHAQKHWLIFNQENTKKD
jgi:ornithine carbamoyltransferase